MPLLLVRKATIFITRETPHGREVLVFRHPDAGIQLPAGTVEEGKTYEQGACREAYEETGLADLTLVKYLGVVELVFEGELRRILKDTFILQSPRGDSTEILIERGILVSIGETSDGYTHITHRADLDPYFPFPGASGWIPAEMVQPQHIVRHFYQMSVQTPPPEQWEHIAEDKYKFSFYWVNISSHPGLTERQQQWWDQVIEQLR